MTGRREGWAAPFAVGIVLALTTGGAAEAHPDETTRDVLQLHGDLRLITSNALDGARPYESFAPGGDLWGIGLPEELAGEFLMKGGEPFLGAFEEGRAVMTREAPGTLVFLAYAHIAEWRAFPVPPHVTDFAELTSFVGDLGRAYGHDADAGFLFRLDAEVESLDWFVVGGMGDLQPDPLRSFLAARTLGRLDGPRRIEAFGTYAVGLTGVASAPGTPVHLHFATVDDADLFVGHVDDAIRIAPGAQVFLPAVPPARLP